MISNPSAHKHTEFEVLFKTYYKPLCVFAYRYLNDMEEAKDIVNDMFEHIWQHYHKLDTSAISHLLYQGVKNRCLNSLEHRKVKDKYNQYVLDLYNEIADSPDDYIETMNKIEKVCAQMNEKTRYILQQCYVERKSYQEVADELALSKESIKKYIIKALKILRENVRSFCF